MKFNKKIVHIPIFIFLFIFSLFFSFHVNYVIIVWRSHICNVHNEILHTYILYRGIYIHTHVCTWKYYKPRKNSLKLYVFNVRICILYKFIYIFLNFIFFYIFFTLYFIFLIFCLTNYLFIISVIIRITIIFGRIIFIIWFIWITS